jgi:integrase
MLTQPDGLGTDYFFPAQGTKRVHLKTDNLKNWFHRKLNGQLQKAGISAPFTAHDLRRTAATRMAEMGFSAVVSDILNHAPQGITRQVYDRYNRGPEIEKALTAWAERLKDILNGEEGKLVRINFNPLEI